MASLGLVVVAAVATTAWRLEVISHPQGIFELVEYTHWAIPFGVALFIGWLALVAPVSSRARRIGLVIATAVGMALWYPLAKYSIIHHFNPTMPWWDDHVDMPLLFGLFHVSVPARWSLLYQLRLVYVVIFLTPILLAGLLWLFGARPSIWQLVASILIYVVAWPAAIRSLDFLSMPHDEDLIEAFRIGTIIPYLVIGLGVLALPHGKMARGAAFPRTGNETTTSGTADERR